MKLDGFIDGLERRANERIKAEQGDYILDGLLHCHKCNTPKQCRVTILGVERTPPCLCKCEVEKREREEAERRAAEFRSKIKEYRRIAFPESEMADWTFENADGSNEKIMNAMRNYVANFEEFREQGKGLLLFGTVGTGKTFAAACVANALIDKGYPVFMTSFSRIADTVWGMGEGKQNYYDSFNRFPLLILDDLAAERDTAYMQEIVFKVIDARCNAGLPLIITTNLTNEEIKHPSDLSHQRAFSRLLGACFPVKVEGVDKRVEKLKADYKPMADLLGL